MTRARVRTRALTMDARVAALETSNSKNQVILETIQRLLEDKFASIDKRLDSIDSRREGFDQPFPPPSDDDDGDGSRQRGERDHRERERGFSSENRMPFVKIEFPRFSDGDDPIEWIYKAEQYFDYFSVPSEKKVKMVSFHLDSEALQWYQWEECASSLSKWEDFTRAFCREFGSHGFEDFAESLFKLRQTGPLKDYIAEFRRLATRICDLSPTFRLSCFVGGLKEELKHDVKLLRPATVHEAMNFAHEVDAKLQKLRYAHSAGNSKSRLPLLPIQNDLVSAKNEVVPRKDMPVKKLTPEEIQYKRQNNLCFYCDEKFVRGHKCARKQILVLDMGYNSSEEEEIVHELQQIEQVAEVNACCITACALYGTPAPLAIKTMKLTVVIKNCPVVVFLDSGSSHNFIDIGMVKKLGWKLDQSHICDVMIIDGGQVQSKGCCAAVPLAIGTYGFSG
ncbi:unnamed protein product [Prunus armeniaca]|uniref:Retrotransposon gag domain-containing protein n=1 Tax=Prunus armeniaca TaxID=36596 RepID=A0A6J5VE67_PRUAR|nr:unnamed protein product [Prunus armeniaca]